MPFEIPKGREQIATATDSAPALDADTAGQVTIEVSDLVSIEQVMDIVFDVATGSDAIVDDYSVDGNSVTIDAEDGAGTNLADADVDEIIVTARGF